MTERIQSNSFCDNQSRFAIQLYFNPHLYSQFVVAYWIIKGKQAELLCDGFKSIALKNIFARVNFMKEDVSGQSRILVSDLS